MCSERCSTLLIPRNDKCVLKGVSRNTFVTLPKNLAPWKRHLTVKLVHDFLDFHDFLDICFQVLKNKDTETIVNKLHTNYYQLTKPFTSLKRYKSHCSPITLLKLTRVFHFMSIPSASNFGLRCYVKSQLVSNNTFTVSRLPVTHY